MTRSKFTPGGSAAMASVGLAALLWGAGKSFLGIANDPDHGLFVLCCFGFAAVAEPIERIAARFGVARADVEPRAVPAPEPAPAPALRPCPRCATPIQRGWGMCPQCLTPQEGA